MKRDDDKSELRSNLALEHGVQACTWAGLASPAHKQVQCLELRAAPEKLLDVALSVADVHKLELKLYSQSKNSSNLAQETSAACQEHAAPGIERCNLRMAVVHDYERIQAVNEANTRQCTQCGCS